MTPEDKLARQRAQVKAWKLANADKVKAHAKAWYEANAEKAKAQAREWAQANPDKVGAKNKAWKQKNAVVLSERAKQKRLDNPRPPRPPAPARAPAAPALPRPPRPRRSPGDFCGPPTERQHAQALARIARRTQRHDSLISNQRLSAAFGSSPSPATPAAPGPAEMTQRRQAALASAERLMALMRAPDHL